MTAMRYSPLDPGVVVGRLNRLITGWVSYFRLGQVSSAYVVVELHAARPTDPPAPDS